MRTAILWVPLLALSGPPQPKAALDDAAHAAEHLEKRAGALLRQKGVDWKRARAEAAKGAAAAKDLEDHYAVLVRLAARLQDGHSAVLTAGEAKGLKGPWPPLEKGPGMFWCTDGSRVFVKNAWGPAEASGVKPGMEVVEVDDVPARKWLDRRVEDLAGLRGFSTRPQAEYFACHWGLGGAAGSTMKVELRSPDGKAKKATLTRTDGRLVPDGPAYPPPGLESVGRQSYGRTARGNAYLHLRDVPQDLPAQLDTMLAAVGDAPGLVLDFRANGGGGTDHDAVVGRFVPKDRPLAFHRTFASAGDRPYTGPVVAIVDAGVRSAGETVSGYFKEYGRVYMIGESPTAGMSAAKETLELPSRLFSIYFAVRSHGRECNEGRGIEGIGIEPHEVVPFDPKDLAAGVDTLIRRAEDLLAKFPRDKVPYKPPR
jgi:C-terminal processing protease CtpA/Prc